jgi:hypothetical protein
MRYGVMEDYDYTSTHKRERLVIWSGAFASVREGEAYTLPKGDGYMVTLEYGGKVRVSCPTPRTDANYLEVDTKINETLIRYRLEYLRSQIEAESISTYEIAELESLVQYIDPADVLLLQWAGVPEFEDAD